MAKVITVSTKFPPYHTRAGQPTYFVEKILNSIYVEEVSINHSLGSKHHTIRKGRRWKNGDPASIRIWSGKPYRSKMTFIAEVKVTVYDIDIVCEIDDSDSETNPTYEVLKNGRLLCEVGSEMWEDIAKNDGLNGFDLYNWFQLKKMKHLDKIQCQIICWNDKIKY